MSLVKYCCAFPTTISIPVSAQVYHLALTHVGMTRLKRQWRTISTHPQLKEAFDKSVENAIPVNEDNKYSGSRATPTSTPTAHFFSSTSWYNFLEGEISEQQ
jgi:hypothetical protein